jgi:hypothetical protein
MKHRIPHDLSHDLARKAVRKALETYKSQFPEYKPDGSWKDDDNVRLWFQPPGGRIEGWVRVSAKDVQLDLDRVPFLFRPFKKKAIQVIEGEVKEWIERARKGELDD